VQTTEVDELLNKYEEAFGNRIGIPYLLPPDKEDDYFNELKKAIETGKPIDEDKWFPSDPDKII